MGEVLYTGSWDKTIKVWNIEVCTVDAVIDVDAGMSFYVGRTYGLCQVVDNCFASGVIVIRLYGCFTQGVVNERLDGIAYIERSFSRD